MPERKCRTTFKVLGPVIFGNVVKYIYNKEAVIDHDIILFDNKLETCSEQPLLKRRLWYHISYVLFHELK